MSLEGHQHVGLRGGLAPGPDGPLQVYPWLLGGETGLQPVARAVERMGVQAHE